VKPGGWYWSKFSLDLFKGKISQAVISIPSLSATTQISSLTFIYLFFQHLPGILSLFFKIQFLRLRPQDGFVRLVSPENLRDVKTIYFTWKNNTLK
jgi:hypothetical protein